LFKSASSGAIRRYSAADREKITKDQSAPTIIVLLLMRADCTQNAGRRSRKRAYTLRFFARPCLVSHSPETYFNSLLADAATTLREFFPTTMPALRRSPIAFASRTNTDYVAKYYVLLCANREKSSNRFSVLQICRPGFAVYKQAVICLTVVGIAPDYSSP